jgi:hypothetical protein
LSEESDYEFNQPPINIAIEAPHNVTILREVVVSKMGGINKVLEQVSNGNGNGTKKIDIMDGDDGKTLLASAFNALAEIYYKFKEKNVK